MFYVLLYVRYIKTKFQTLRQQIKKKIKDSYQGYLENLLGLNDSDNTCYSKKLFSFLKNSRRDQQGTPPLKHNNILHSDTKTKANIFNQQFNSVFTSKEPLSLSRLAKMLVQDLRNAGGLPSDTIPDRQQDSNTNMPEIDISLNGLLKLLHNLKPGKAAGPDKLKPLLLRELWDEIALIIKVSKVAKIRKRYNQVPHLTQDTNGKVTNSQKTPQTRAKRSALSQQVTTKHI